MDDDYVDMPFSSTLSMELHYTSACLSTTNNASCFTVEVFNNGKPLKLDTCIEGNKSRGSTSPICAFEDFLGHINKRVIKGNLFDKCYLAYNPYPQTYEAVRSFL